MTIITISRGYVPTDVAGMFSNVEIKAKLPNKQHALSVAKKLSGEQGIVQVHCIFENSTLFQKVLS